MTARVEVTIKAGSGYQDPWYRASGDDGEELQTRIALDFGFDVGDGEILVATIKRAEAIFQGLAAIPSTLGATVASEGSDGRTASPGDPWDRTPSKPGAQPEATPEPTLFDEIAAIDEVEKLREFYVDHTTEIQADDALLTAWKNRGVHLTTAGADG
jgi:hypothetical protein